MGVIKIHISKLTKEWAVEKEMKRAGVEWGYLIKHPLDFGNLDADPLVVALCRVWGVPTGDSLESLHGGGVYWWHNGAGQMLVLLPWDH